MGILDNELLLIFAIDLRYHLIEAFCHCKPVHAYNTIRVIADWGHPYLKNFTL